MECSHCKNTRIYKEPKNKEEFSDLVDREMDKAYFVNYAMAEEKAYEKVGYNLIDCPFCKDDSSLVE